MSVSLIGKSTGGRLKVAEHTFSRNRVLGRLVLALTALSFAIICSGPIWDNDFWWHLSSGRFFVDNRSFMQSDPFTFPGTDVGVSGKTVLNGYWLGQVILYLAYRLSGYYGVIFLRAAVLTSALLSSYMLSRKFGVSRFSATALCAATGFMLVNFTGERPQLFSFLLLPHAFILLEGLRKGYENDRVSWWPALGLVFMMLVWPSLHRGFLIGVAIIAVYATTETADLFIGKKKVSRAFGAFWLVVAVSILATLVSPNSLLAYSDIAGMLSKTNEWQSTEFMSPVVLTIEHGYYLPVYWASLVFAVSVLALSLKAVRLSHIAILGFLIAVSLSSYRFIPFLLLLGMPIALGCISRRGQVNKVLARASTIVAASVIVLFLAYAMAGYDSALGAAIENPIRQDRFPEGAADFVIQNRPVGNILNHYNWGGYLGWMLYPDYKVFIDGRSVNLQAFYDYKYILWVREVYGMLLDRYRINTIVMMPRTPFTGERYALIDFLARDPEWHLVYMDRISMVYLRGERNGDIIGKYSLPK